MQLSSHPEAFHSDDSSQAMKEAFEPWFLQLLIMNKFHFNSFHWCNRKYCFGKPLKFEILEEYELMDGRKHLE